MFNWFKADAPLIKFKQNAAGQALGEPCDGFFISSEMLTKGELDRLLAAAGRGWRPEKWEKLP
jgi:hypothetical protein